MKRCDYSQLSIISAFEYTHGNKDATGNDFTTLVSVGSSVNLFCDDNSTRITEDKWDDDPFDFNMTVLCKPTEQFDLLNENFPVCLAWCPSEKPAAPAKTGLILSASDNNTRYPYRMSTQTKEHSFYSDY